MRLFINRPILSIVISLIISLCGILAMFNMPLEQYPNISPPSISISANFPGASALTLDKTVAAQISPMLNSLDNLLYMNSTSSSDGGISIRLTFQIGTNLNNAVNEVLNRVHAAMPLLPAIVQKLGVTVRKSSPDNLMYVEFYNDGQSNFDEYYLNNYVKRTVKNSLLLIDGIGDIKFYAHFYALRIWLDINKMNLLNVSSQDIYNALKDQSNEYIIGASNSMPNSKSDTLVFNMVGSSVKKTVKDFENIIIKAVSNQFIYIKDVAQVEMGASDYSIVAEDAIKVGHKFYNRPTAVMPIFMDPSANQLSVKNKVLAQLESEAKNFPSGLKYKVIFDATQFVSASISNVESAFFESIILVGLVILLFLQNYRASIITLFTIPVSVLGSFACLYALGFTINTLSLFALVLAIGIVVDDAIVIIENIERLKKIHSSLAIKEVVALAINEVFGAVIAIALVLSVVFIPVMFFGGLSGGLYRQFAVTIACTVIVSAITALTLTPALSVLLLNRPIKVNKFSQKFNHILEKITDFYLRIARKIISWGKYTIISFILILSIVVILFKIIPLSFVPSEDQGYFITSITLPSASSLEETKALSQKIAHDILKRDGVDHIMQITGINPLKGGNNSYSALLIAVLKNWADRTETVDQLVDYTKILNLKYKNALIMPFNVPPFKGLNVTAGVEFYLEDRVVGDLKILDEVATTLDKNLMKHKEIKNSTHNLDTKVEKISVIPNIDKAKKYNVNVVDIYNSLQSVFSTNNVNTTFVMQSLVWVIMQAQFKYRANINDLKNVYIKNISDNLIPLNSVVRIDRIKAPQNIERFNDYLATKVTVEPNSNYTMVDVMNIISYEMQKLKKYDYEWSGTSYMQKSSQATSALAFAFSLVMIYLVLCALYEMWRLPFVVIMGIPFALFGSAIMLLFRSQPNDLYFQISLLALLGLSAKNIILLIEFAHKHFMEGYSAIDSVLYALKVRFRPILMTSITFIAGALPLVFATGAGAGAEHSVGIGIIGGMLGSVILGTLFVPSYFVVIMKNFKKK